MSSPARARRWLRISGAIAGLPLLLVLALLLLRLRDAAKLARASAELDRRIAAYQAISWGRPGLRGAPIEGNAAEAQRDAVGTLGRLDDKVFDDFAERMLTGRGPSAAVLALVPPNAEKLKAVRAAARRTVATTGIDIEHWFETPTPKYGDLLRA